MNYPTGDIANLLTPERREQDMHVRTVNPSCLEKYRVRCKLRALLIDDTDLINGYMVTRVSNKSYDVDKRKLTYDEALAVLECRIALPALPKKKPKTPKPRPVITQELILTVDDLPLFKLERGWK